jgi:hypothetical protein
MAGKWYKQGLEEASIGPANPPSEPGRRDYVAYMEGYVDGVREIERDADEYQFQHEDEDEDEDAL